MASVAILPLRQSTTTLFAILEHVQGEKKKKMLDLFRKNYNFAL